MKKTILVLSIIILLGVSFVAGMTWKSFLYTDICLDLGGGMNPEGYPICLLSVHDAKKDLPPAELIHNNIQQTSFSADITLQECTEISKEGNYLTFSCHATVHEVFKGQQEMHGDLLLHKTIEVSMGLKAQDFNKKRILVSLDKNNEGYYYEPDVAYSFEYSVALAKMFSSFYK